MKNIFCFLLPLLFVTQVLASDGYMRRNKGTYVGISCDLALSKSAVFCKKKSDPATCSCKNVDRMGSLLYCGFQESGSEKVKHQFEEWFMERCPNVTVAKMEKVYQNATKYLKTKKEIEGFNKTIPIHVPLKYDKKVYGYALNTNELRYHNFDYAMDMGGGLMGYWALIILIGTVCNVFEKLLPNQWLSMNRSVSNIRFVKLCRKHLILPALFGRRHTERTFFLGVIPTRIQSLVLFAYFSMLVVFPCVRYVYMEHNLTWPRKRVQLARYIGDRTAVLSLFSIPITYLFAGRNNFLIWMTGWKQSTFYTYHKWMARFCILMCAAHSIAMWADSIWMGKIKTRKLTVWYRTGCVAMIAFTVIFFLSLTWIRNYNYELFLNFHIGLAIIAIAGVWHHAGNFDYNEFTYAACAVWAFDRFIRICRLASFGVKPATVTVIADEVLHVKVERPSWWPTFPGAFGYIHFLKSSCFWQSHPFTIVEQKGNEIHFYVKIKRGVTETIYKRLLEKPGMTDTISVCVEGPYGDHKNLKVYDDVIIVTSSNGIPSVFAYARELSEHQKNTGKKGFVKFYWIIRHWHSLDWFLDELREMKQFENVEIIVHVTKYQDGRVGERFLSSSSSSETSDNDEKESVTEKSVIETIKAAFPYVQFKEGRPDLDAIVKSDLQEFNGHNVAVMTCAHNTMTDSVRKTVAEQVTEFDGRLDLFEELQIW